jgi:hypothetical protein
MRSTTPPASFFEGVCLTLKVCNLLLHLAVCLCHWVSVAYKGGILHHRGGVEHVGEWLEIGNRTVRCASEKAKKKGACVTGQRANERQPDCAGGVTSLAI